MLTAGHMRHFTTTETQSDLNFVSFRQEFLRSIHLCVQIIGKPVDKADAKRILNLLSDRTHHVYTAFYLIKENKEYEEVVISEVTFEKLSEQTIDEYIKSGSPMDKAGAYGAQDNNDFKLIKKITGSWSNVIGFPVDEIKKAISNF